MIQINEAMPPNKIERANVTQKRIIKRQIT